jgi:acetyl-CoA acetyltransferase
MVEGGADIARRLWDTCGIRRADVGLPQLYDGFSPFVYFWLEAMGFCPVGEAHRFVADGGIDSDSPSGLPVLSGGGSLGTGRMHGAAQLLECYLQLAGRAAERQRAHTSVAVACYGPPHIGGAIALSTELL